MAENVRAELEAILADARERTKSVRGTRVLAGRVLRHDDETLRMAVNTGIVEVPLDAVERVQAFGEDGHVRLQVSAPESITPIGGPGGIPDPRPRPGGWPLPLPDPVGPRVTPGGIGFMSDATWTRYCEDTGTVTHGLSYDATDDSWCAEELDDWE